MFDLRVSENRDASQSEEALAPVINIPRAHEDISSKPGPKGKKVARSVTSLTHIPGKPFSLISSGSFDGSVFL